jgi:hypothetical protein
MYFNPIQFQRRKSALGWNENRIFHLLTVPEMHFKLSESEGTSCSHSVILSNYNSLTVIYLYANIMYHSSCVFYECLNHLCKKGVFLREQLNNIQFRNELRPLRTSILITASPNYTWKYPSNSGVLHIASSASVKRTEM